MKKLTRERGVPTIFASITWNREGAKNVTLDEGIVAGGGVALLWASAVLGSLTLEADEQIGVKVVARAIEEPIRWIAINAGHEGSIVVERTMALTDDDGFNAQTDSTRISWRPA